MLRREEDEGGEGGEGGSFVRCGLSRLITSRLIRRNETIDFTEVQVRFVSLEREYIPISLFRISAGTGLTLSLVFHCLDRGIYTLTRENAFVNSSEEVFFVSMCCARYAKHFRILLTL